MMGARAFAMFLQTEGYAFCSGCATETWVA